MLSSVKHTAVPAHEDYVAVLGSTGSVGLQTLDVLRNLNSRTVYLLAAFRNETQLFEQCVEFRPAYAYLACPMAAKRLQNLILATELPTQVISKIETLNNLIAEIPIRTVVAAMSGDLLLEVILNGLNCGAEILLANKEPVVMAGRWIQEALKQAPGSIIPLDSEHNSLYQLLGTDSIGRSDPELEKVILTASGGPFWQLPVDALQSVTKAQALKHPTWQMGAKISIDSATLMNKCFELIEAKWLFDLQAKQLDVLIHPQSMVHAMVRYPDGTYHAHISKPDMRLGIAQALSRRRSLPIFEPLDLTQQPLTFYPVDKDRFKSISFAYKVMNSPYDLGCVLHAANEMAVQLFLMEKIEFLQIEALVQSALERFATPLCESISALRALGQDVRHFVQQKVGDSCLVS